MNAITLPYKWHPRPHQIRAFQALQGGVNRSVLVWPRRYGKDAFSLNYTAMATQQRVGMFLHLLPLTTQARKVIWQGIGKDGRRLIDQAFPMEMRSKTREQEMSIEFKNGSIWMVGGSDNFDAMVGTNPVGIVFSEFALADPNAWAYLRPILAENDGWALFISTPRGKNHYYDLYEMAKTNPDWYCERIDPRELPVDERPYPLEVVDDEIAAGMDPNLAKQEFFCSFEAPNQGAILGDEMEAAELQKRITAVPYEPILPVHTAWDLGVSDETCIVFFQLLGNEIRVVDFVHDRGKGLPFYADTLRRKRQFHRFVWGDFCLPHDIVVTELGSGQTRLRILKDLMEDDGVQNWKIGSPGKYPETLVPIRAAIARAYFDSTRAEHLVRALRGYEREYDEKRKVFRDQPVHNWACFEGSTLIWTRSGYKAIKDLPKTGEVMTQCGWKRYENPHVTRHAPLVEVAFDDGTTVNCTEEHRFLTDSGWSIARHLTPGSVIQSISIPSPGILTGIYTAFGKVRNIGRRAVNTSIERFGKMFLGPFLKSTTSIMWMEIPETTPSPISNVFLRKSTMRGWCIAGRPPLHKPGTRLRNGTAPRKGDSGIADKRNDQNLGRNGSAWTDPVNGAALWFRWWSESKTRSVFAPTSVRVKRVTPLNRTADVWCLTVPDVGHFCLANGAVVANSHPVDAFREMAIYCTRGRPGPRSIDQAIERHRKKMNRRR